MRVGTRGSISVLFAGLLLPVALFAVALSLEIAAYYHERDLLQAELDQSALIGADSLPDAAAAVRAATERLSAGGIPASISVAAGSLEVFHTGLFRLHLAGLLGGIGHIPVPVYSRAGKEPMRLIVALDRSRSLAPSWPAGEPWGEPSRWPAAAGVSRTEAQRCYNPVFAPLKRVAALGADRSTLLASSRAAVPPGASFEVVLYPGSGRPIELAENARDELCARLSRSTPYALDRRSPLAGAVWDVSVNLDEEADFAVALGWIAAVLLDPQSASFAGRRLAVFLSGDAPRVAGRRFPDGPGAETLRAALARLEDLCRRVGLACELLYVALNESPPPDLDSRLAALSRLAGSRALRLSARAARSEPEAWMMVRSFSERVYLER